MNVALRTPMPGIGVEVPVAGFYAAVTLPDA